MKGKKIRKVVYRWRWGESVLKSGEGGPGGSFFVYILKNRPGIYAYTEHSPYVGHLATMVEAETKEDMRNAMRILKREAIIDSISEEMKYNINPINIERQRR